MVTVNGRILENRYTTVEWTTNNPILADRVQGYEVDTYGSPIGMKMGDGVTNWNSLPYWFDIGPGLPDYILSIPTGSPVPLIINFTSAPFVSYAFGGKFVVKLVDSSTSSHQIWDCIVEEHYTDTSKTVLRQVNFTGHWDFTYPFTTDDLLLIVYI